MGRKSVINPSTGNLDVIGSQIGGTVIGGDPDEVLYTDSSGNLASHPNFKFDGTNVVLKAGVKLIFDGG